ncbi:unnamed protein product [Effrenium voratum]|uniref:EF-hand domain-containing protein n=1 Tax=Effrenium voratum TaxID=2562239 RepID=A0AA36J2N5_9DINO|nr:unnamed protein product [Effrenium voratum]
MSLQDLLREQQVIVAEQQSMRAEFQQMQRKLDDYVKSELRRLSSRLDANDARIQRVLGDGPTPTKFLESAKNLFADPASGARQEPRMSPLPETGGYKRSPLVPSPRSEKVRQSMQQPSRRNSKASSNDLDSKTDQLVEACKKAPVEDVWSSPGDSAVTSTVLDHAEENLRRCFAKTREGQRNPNNPLLGLNAIFKRLDQNHSGKVDRQEFADLCAVLDFNCSADVMSGLFNRYDVDRSNYITVDEFGRMMFKLEGDKEGKALSTIARLREALALRAGGFETLKAMASQFRIIDHDKSGELTKEEFNTALDILFSCFQLRFSAAEKLSLFQKFDRDNSGTVNYEEFIRGVRGKMNDFRLDWVNQAFGILDRDGSGVVTAAEMAQTYDVSKNPAVQSGKVTPQKAMSAFMQHFDQQLGKKPGSHPSPRKAWGTTREEFIENYQWVSASIDSVSTKIWPSPARERCEPD